MSVLSDEVSFVDLKARR